MLSVMSPISSWYYIITLTERNFTKPGSTLRIKIVWVLRILLSHSLYLWKFNAEIMYDSVDSHISFLLVKLHVEGRSHNVHCVSRVDSMISYSTVSVGIEGDSEINAWELKSEVSQFRGSQHLFFEQFVTVESGFTQAFKCGFHTHNQKSISFLLTATFASFKI